MAVNIQAADFKANTELNRVRNMFVWLAAVLQLLSVGYLQGSCAGHYKKIRYQINLLSYHLHS